MNKIGILGGTFDPPHNGHLLIANEVLEALELDEIWFLPNQEPPHKSKSGGASNIDRIKMLELATCGHPKFRIEKLELERSGPSYTYETMKLMNEMFPEIDFYFIIGADMVEYLSKWYKIDQLINIVKFVGVNRPDYEEITEFPIINVTVPEMGVSSKLIRDRLKENKTIRYLVPESVQEYIEEKKLYES
ncbi:nicotinate-nucleotide adenylyltransferase [Bacillus sp. DNRA2]|uniref:nicotinate-nucleotide adenylyltransferase n=1 Tax=Bacillus sp. DNRA2 TaxID=2723053 RepID=UPI00145E0DA0|nr:nicotinate-nucleotide adenylyltransferase [Bacillus sp. DNRA2]NMD70629.1 nicotinate-nucleotide adenylyltransferase [Bacillus sp. DNRA2]